MQIDAKPTLVSSTWYDELGSHFASKNQYQKPSESKAKHKSLMWYRWSMTQYLAVTKQLRLKVNNILDMLQRSIVMSQRQTEYWSTPTLHDNRALKLSHRDNLNQYYCSTNKHLSHSIIECWSSCSMHNNDYDDYDDYDLWCCTQKSNPAKLQSPLWYAYTSPPTHLPRINTAISTNICRWFHQMMPGGEPLTTHHLPPYTQ